MIWHYQLMKYPVTHGPNGHPIESYGIHEFYVFESGGNSWTDETAEVVAENPKELRNILLQMLMDLDAKGIRDYDSGELI